MSQTDFDAACAAGNTDLILQVCSRVLSTSINTPSSNAAPFHSPQSLATPVTDFDTVFLGQPMQSAVDCKRTDQDLTQYQFRPSESHAVQRIADSDPFDSWLQVALQEGASSSPSSFASAATPPSTEICFPSQHGSAIEMLPHQTLKPRPLPMTTTTHDRSLRSSAPRLSATVQNGDDTRISMSAGSHFAAQSHQNGAMKRSAETMLAPRSAKIARQMEHRFGEPQPPMIVPNLVAVPKQSGVDGKNGCIDCGGRVVINGQNDGLRCTRDFNRENKEIDFRNGQMLMGFGTTPPRSFPVENHTTMLLTPMSTFPSHSSNHFGSPATVTSPYFDGNGTQQQANLVGTERLDINGERAGEDDFATLQHTSVSAARDYLHDRLAQDCKPILLDGDDWQSVKYQWFDGFCIELLQALRVPPNGAPAGFDENERKIFMQNHAKIFNQVKQELRTRQQLCDVQARVVLAMDQVVRVHEIGIPKAVYAKSHAKTHRGYEPEERLICSVRARAVIDLAKSNKYVALDIIHQKNLEQLAQAPLKYVERKLANFKTNAARSATPRTKLAKSTKGHRNPVTKSADCTIEESRSTTIGLGIENMFDTSEGSSFPGSSSSANDPYPLMSPAQQHDGGVMYRNLTDGAYYTNELHEHVDTHDFGMFGGEGNLNCVGDWWTDMNGY